MHTTEGIILRKQDFGEADAVFTIYTKDFGKLRLLAQGVKKEGAKLKGHLEPLNHARITFVLGRNGERLTHATLLNFGPELRTDFAKLYAAHRVVGCIDNRTFPGERDRPLWDLLVNSLTRLDNGAFSASELQLFFGSFEKELEACLGYGRPES
ncbi:MAG: DNA repair protein RecO [Candidatus Sungiibacteriota bacterium]|uniref:DNA repair protein RecO n=1 Tax=Candidatus Sungiibacteriota bacterium TaxID=2750080 RepID=A0A7T5UQZ5_9BACT|nr:MAG: DNA repair protein RecO [Candidatus Sungbacteria bacterium]